jgi:hypothetical protein
MRVDAGRVARAYELVDGRPVPVDGAGMAFTVDGRRWSATDMVASEVQAAADHSRLSWLLAGDGLSVRVVVEADRRAGVVRTGAEVAGRGRLGHVELDRWADLAVDGFESTGEPVAYNVGPVGLGQPVFGPGFFAGVEHPVAENLVGPGGRGAALGIPLAVDLGPEPTPLPAAIMGAGGLEEFWDYVDTLRPVPPRLVTLANNWYHLGATGLMDEAAVRAEVQGFAGVADRHGLVLDFLCLDDGWEGEWEPATGLWGRMAPARFPHGIGPLGPGIGLWLSAFGGYADRRKERLAFAPAGGFEVDPSAGLLCAAGSRYRAHLLDALTRWTREGVAYWKLDGLRFDCEEPTHGHPVGPGARTAQVDAFRGLVDGIRAVRPDAVVAFTIGSHPSPWWLSTVDFLWRGGLDDTAADRPGSRLDRFDTYVDTCLHAYRRAALPVSALVTFSIVESAAAGYRDDRSGPNGWARHCWLAAGRGTLHQDLYVAPDSLSEPEWAVLAEALAWARRHEHVLARSRMVLGDPAAGEVYGFLARKGDEATLCLRNPGDRPQSLDPDWAAHTGFPDAPRTLAPFEVVVLTRRR